jgi:hypothetical protein
MYREVANNSIVRHTIFKTSELTTPRFLFRAKEIMNIDYTKLNDQIVKQAFDAASTFLTEAQKQKLFQNKIDRAEQMIRARAAVYYQSDQ